MTKDGFDLIIYFPYTGVQTYHFFYEEFARSSFDNTSYRATLIDNSAVPEIAIAWKGSER